MEAIVAKLPFLKATAMGAIQILIRDSSSNIWIVIIITRRITMRIRAIRTSISQGMGIMAKSLYPILTRIIRINI
jgi:hypothetical protein